METTIDLKREQVAARLVESAWHGTLIKMKKFHKFDYAIKSVASNQIDGFVELKCRKTASDQYLHYMISEEKVRWGLETWHRYAIPCFLVVAWSNITAYFTIKSTMGMTMVLSGRMDEHDGAESEPCILIPVSYFKEVKP